MTFLPFRTFTGLQGIGVQAAQPTSGKVTVNVLHERNTGLVRLDFTLRRARIPVTDATTSGSSGSLKLVDLEQFAFVPMGCRQDYTAFREGSALTGGAGDAAFVMAVGTVAADAGDAALTGTEANLGSVTGTITLSEGTGVGTQVNGALSAINGTATASDIILNWSGSAATIDANSTIDVTGTISLAILPLGDD
jgi:hypothetical protein